MALDNKYKVVTLFLDIVKAFDTIRHGIQLMKCQIYRIRGQALSFLRSFRLVEKYIFKLVIWILTKIVLSVEFHRVRYLDHCCFQFLGMIFQVFK